MSIGHGPKKKKEVTLELGTSFNIKGITLLNVPYELK